MKKIGCVLAFCNNYGTMLQSYATLKKIESLGNQCEIIRYSKRMSVCQKLMMLIRLLRIGEFSSQSRKVKRIANMKLYPSYKQNKAVKDNAFKRFSEEKLKPYFKEYIGYDALKKGSLNYNLVLVGSDQIWSLVSLYGGYYNLMFVDDSVPKVSYASSFGVTVIPAFQQKATKAYLDRMQMIGVREHSGKKIVDGLSENRATVVADPTMLLSPEEWEAEIANVKANKDKPYIFCYFLGKNKEHRRAAEKLKRLTGYEIVAVCHNDEYVKSDEEFGDDVPYDVGPLQFLRYIHDAAYVCTDSFHCSVFSILFKRQFVSFYRYQNGSKGSRNTRIDNLLGILHLSERVYNGDVSIAQRPINYKFVMERLADYREESLRFLNKELSLAK